MKEWSLITTSGSSSCTIVLARSFFFPPPLFLKSFPVHGHHVIKTNSPFFVLSYSRFTADLPQFPKTYLVVSWIPHSPKFSLAHLYPPYLSFYLLVLSSHSHFHCKTSLPMTLVMSFAYTFSHSYFIHPMTLHTSCMKIFPLFITTKCILSYVLDLLIPLTLLFLIGYIIGISNLHFKDKVLKFLLPL